MDEKTYRTKNETIQAIVLQFLRAFEAEQQQIQFNDVAGSQRRLNTAVGDSLTQAAAAIERLDVPPDFAEAHDVLRTALRFLLTAHEKYTTSGGWPAFAAAYFSSRRAQCEALQLLYERRDSFAVIEPYFRLVDVLPAHIASRGATHGGIKHIEATASHHDYSLYIPESYDPTRQWPLVVCLHGGNGRGDEYIWTWLRIARSRGYLLLSPKSIGQTWSIMQPSIDSASILAMLDSLSNDYEVDNSRVLLTGLSDGATFSFLFGLANADRFAAIAPVAGVLSPTAENLLTAKQSTAPPLHMVHGALDPIFPVQMARAARRSLESLNYPLTYTELPQWGHAFTYAINEEIVLPWFEQIITTS